MISCALWSIYLDQLCAEVYLLGSAYSNTVYRVPYEPFLIYIKYLLLVYRLSRSSRCSLTRTLGAGTEGCGNAGKGKGVMGLVLRIAMWLAYR